MTPENRKALLGLINEYGNSLTRIQAEKELMKLMEQRAVVECATAAKAFRMYATAAWRDQISAIKDELEQQLILFETVSDLKAGENVVELRAR